MLLTEWYTVYMYTLYKIKAMTYNILVSCPLKCHTHAGGRLLLIMLLHIFCTKPAYLTARAWPFSYDRFQ